MDYKYFPHTEDDLQAMLGKVGVESLDDLYAQIPESIRFQGDYDLPLSQSELEIRQAYDLLGRENRQLVCFAGMGVYDHYAPAPSSSPPIPPIRQRYPRARSTTSSSISR